MEANNLKIIFLEGLPCSGKTTLGNLLKNHSPNKDSTYFFDELSKDNPITFFPFMKYDFNDTNFPKYIY